jgi:hypothetical protein
MVGTNSASCSMASFDIGCVESSGYTTSVNYLASLNKET